MHRGKHRTQTKVMNCKANSMFYNMYNKIYNKIRYAIGNTSFNEMNKCYLSNFFIYKLISKSEYEVFHTDINDFVLFGIEREPYRYDVINYNIKYGDIPINEDDYERIKKALSECKNIKESINKFLKENYNRNDGYEIKLQNAKFPCYLLIGDMFCCIERTKSNKLFLNGKGIGNTRQDILQKTYYECTNKHTIYGIEIPPVSYKAAANLINTYESLVLESISIINTIRFKYLNNSIVNENKEKRIFYYMPTMQKS